MFLVLVRLQEESSKEDIKVVKDRWSDLGTYRKGFKKDEALNDTLHRVSGQTEGAGKVSTLTTNHGAEIGLHKGVLGSRGCRKGWMVRTGAH
ncbi:hypothetical protein HZH66_001959 [Vespula vulgaris]|uniref:Uncharacterized protein n=1 Tax=Vespula vulgaris TaxID=7454 RepID=A0A834KJ09_VESVU|nr:hypothetical protein HZH66_001959 [Vespula vulgaris]